MKPKNEARGADILISNHGTIFLFRPLTNAARLHLVEKHCLDATWFGGALVVEHRYAGNLAITLQRDGLTVG
jgi:hypothetical protein